MAQARITKRITKSGPRWDVKWRTAGRGGQDLKKTFKTKADADYFAASLVIEGGVLPRPDKMTLREAFIRFQTNKATAGVSKGTMDQFKWSYRHLKDLENQTLDSLTVERINKHLETMKKRGATNSVLVKVQLLLSGIFDSAISEGHYLQDNPMLKTVKIRRRAPRKGPVMLPMETVNKLAAAIPEHHRVAFTFLVTMGLRRGECEALKRSDFAPDFSTVSISRTKTNSYEGPTKTPKSKRTLAIPKFLQEQLRFVKPFGKEQRMFHVNQSWGKKVLKPACEAIGIEPLVPHDLRDVAAGTLMRSGLDLPSVSKFLGHASVAITAQAYLGTMDDSSERAAALMDQIREAM